MINVTVTYDTTIKMWVIYRGWIHFIEGNAWQCDEWLNKNSEFYVEVK